MHLLHSIFEWLELIIDVSAALVMVLAFVVAIISYFRITIRNVFFSTEIIRVIVCTGCIRFDGFGRAVQ